ncbi:hypothetical protein DACRYDRAFT_29761, partial [Dacryopinax primogenitus]
VNTLHHHGVPPHALHLKTGAVCALMRNLSMQKKLVKNAHVVVEALNQCFVQVCILNMDGQLGNELHCIPHIHFTFKPHCASWTVIHNQLPLCLAYATTFNSCQGLTLDRSVLDCCTDVFAHGQLYTALTHV